MNIPNESFFADLDVLNIDTTDPVQTEMSEPTKDRRPEDVDAQPVEAEEVKDESGATGDGSAKRVAFNYKSTATWAVRILDGVNGKMLPSLYERKMYTRDERQRVADMDAMEAQGLSFEVSNSDEKLLEKRDRIRALVDAIPMSDDEKEELSEALSDVMEEADMRLSPMNKLLITLGMVEGVRLLPLLTLKK